MASTPVSRDTQLLERQNALLAQSAMLRQRARRQTTAVLAPLEQWQDGMQGLQQATPRTALWALTAASMLFGKTLPWGLKALRLWRLWRALGAWFKR